MHVVQALHEWKFMIQIETTLEAISRFVVETKVALEQLISETNKENISTIPEASRKGAKLSEMLGKSLRNVGAPTVL